MHIKSIFLILLSISSIAFSYTNAEEPIAFENSPSSPPLATDDPGTPGKNGFELNVISDCDHTSNSHACDSGLDFAMGVGETAQVRISKFYQKSSASGEPSMNGVGATDIGIKYRFYDNNGVQLATFPSYQLNDAKRQIDLDGKEIESEGRSVYLPIIVSKEVGLFTVVANAGYRKNLDHAENNSVFTSVAIGHGVSETSRLMTEISSEKIVNGARRTDVRVGWVKVIFPNSASKYQTSLFTSLGRSVGPTDDGRVHYTITAGISFARKGN